MQAMRVHGACGLVVAFISKKECGIDGGCAGDLRQFSIWVVFDVLAEIKWNYRVKPQFLN